MFRVYFCNVIFINLILLLSVLKRPGLGHKPWQGALIRRRGFSIWRSLSKQQLYRWLSSVQTLPWVSTLFLGSCTVQNLRNYQHFRLEFKLFVKKLCGGSWCHVHPHNMVWVIFFSARFLWSHGSVFPTSIYVLRQWSSLLKFTHQLSPLPFQSHF